MVAAQVPLRTEEWKLDVVHRTRGRLPLRGLVVQRTPTEVVIKVILDRTPGKLTGCLLDTIPAADVERVELLGPKERQELVERMEMLAKERALLREQVRLNTGGKIDLPPGEALALKPAPWGKGGKGSALGYTSTYFRLVSDARKDIVYLTAVQLEQVFGAYVRCLPPRERTPRPVTVLLTKSLEEYGALVRERGPNILNPAFYDPARNEVVCGCDLERLGGELARAKAFHEKLRGDLLARKKELNRVYNRRVPPELLKPVNDSLERVAAAEKRNHDVFGRSHARLLRRLFHEAFHAYLAQSVFGDRKVRVPPWLDEGLAQVFETAPVDAGELRLGRPDPERRRRARAGLKNGELVPLATLLKASPRQFQVAHAEDKRDSDRHYLTAWALAFYLTFDRQVLGTPALDDYLKALERGVDAREAFQGLTGQPLAKFEEGFRTYLEHLTEEGKSSPPKKK